jgi:hypothetical protein
MIEQINPWDEWQKAKAPKKKRKRKFSKRVHKNSQKYHLLQEHPESFIKEAWIKHGIYQAAEILDASPKVIWHLAREKGWKRPLPDFLALAAQTGNWKISKNYYIKEKEDETTI